jgi:hypothetical protein
MTKIKKELSELRLLLRSVPPITLMLFVLSVAAMNLAANKSISVPIDGLALDCGILVSWFAFLVMDVVTKHFGPKAATELSVVAICFNLSLCALLFLCSLVPGVWGEASVEGCEDIINNALDRTFGGTWYVLAGSTAAFLVSSVINNFTNYAVGKAFRKKPDGPLAYVCRTYISTAVGQFADNLTFALLVSHFFFGWTFFQCVSCAVTGMIVELLCECVFSALGYKVCEAWKKGGVGKEYLDYISNKEAAI